MVVVTKMEAVEVSAGVTEADLVVAVDLLHHGVKTIAIVEDKMVVTKIEAVEVTAGVNGVDPVAVVDILHHGVKTIVMVAMMEVLDMAIKVDTIQDFLYKLGLKVTETTYYTQSVLIRNAAKSH